MSGLTFQKIGYCGGGGVEGRHLSKITFLPLPYFRLATALLVVKHYLLSVLFLKLNFKTFIAYKKLGSVISLGSGTTHPKR